MKRLTWWGLFAAVIVLDIVTVVLHPFPGWVRWTAVALMTAVILLFVFLRLLEARQMAEQRRAAFAHLERVRQASSGGPTST